MRPGEALLVTYPGTHPWYPRVWQRVLYPRTVVLLSREQTSAAKVARMRARYGIRFAVAMGSPPPDPGFARVRDLGPLLGRERSRAVRALATVSFPADRDRADGTARLGVRRHRRGRAAPKIRRRLGWNESFLVGAGTCAAALFPISLLWPRRALDLLMILVGLCLAGSVVARVRQPAPRRRSRRPTPFRLGWKDASARRGDRPDGRRVHDPELPIRVLVGRVRDLCVQSQASLLRRRTHAPVVRRGFLRQPSAPVPAARGHVRGHAGPPARRLRLRPVQAALSALLSFARSSRRSPQSGGGLRSPSRWVRPCWSACCPSSPRPRPPEDRRTCPRPRSSPEPSRRAFAANPAEPFRSSSAR